MSKIRTPIDITTATHEELKREKAMLQEIANHHKGTAKELELKRKSQDRLLEQGYTEDEVRVMVGGKLY